MKKIYALKGMNAVTGLLLVAALTSCVSAKKYAALEQEVERLQASEEVLDALRNQRPAPTDEPNPEIEGLQEALKNAHLEIKALTMRIDQEEIAPLPPEQMMRLEEERIRKEEMAMMQEREQAGNKRSSQLLNDNAGKLRMATTAADAAMSKYEAPKVVVDKEQFQIIISVSDEVLFSGDGESISASGETFISRLMPVLEVSRGMQLFVLGIANGNVTAESMKKANLLHQALSKESTYRTFDAMVGSLNCDNSISGRKTNCDKVEIVLRVDNDEALQLLLMGQ